ASVSLSAGETTTRDFVLDPAGSISGTVTDVNGNPVPNLVLYLSGYEPPHYATNPEGEYIIPGLEAGVHTVNIETPYPWYILVNGWDISEELLTHTTVDVNLGQTTWVDFTQMPPVITEWLRVDRLRIKRNIKGDPNKDSLKVQGEFNTSGASTINTDGAVFTFGNGNTYTVTLTGGNNFTGGRGGKWKYSDKAAGVSASFLLGQGGSTRNKYSLSTKKQNISAAVASAYPLNVNMQQAGFGAFDENVGIFPIVVTDRKAPFATKGATFRLPKNTCNTPKMFIDALIIKRDLAKQDKDSLRIVINYESAANFNPDNDTLIISIDQEELQIDPNNWTKISRKEQKGQ
ncbi:unnamed protein product, partial [marine sediment metagenome]